MAVDPTKAPQGGGRGEVIGPRRRAINVIATVESVRERHELLALPLNWSRLRMVLYEEGIELMRLDMVDAAKTIGELGTYVLAVNSSLPARQHTRVAAHEYGHIKLHRSQDGITRETVPCRRGDPRELEAELFAALLLAGPEATPATPRIARLIAALEVADRRKKTPAQLQLPIAAQRRTPPAIDPRSPLQAELDYRNRNKAKPLLASSIGKGVSHDAIRFRTKPDGKSLEFFHYDLGWLTIYDVKFMPSVDGRPVRQLTKVGDRWAQARYFVLSSKSRFVYAFKTESESRRPTPANLDRQIPMSAPVASRTTQEAKLSSTVPMEDRR